MLLLAPPLPLGHALHTCNTCLDCWERMLEQHPPKVTARKPGVPTVDTTIELDVRLEGYHISSLDSRFGYGSSHFQV